VPAVALIALAALTSWGCDGEEKACGHGGCDGGCDDTDDGVPDDAGAVALEPVLLVGFEELMESLTTGHEVRAVLRYGNCTLDGAGPGPDAIGGMAVDTFEYFAEGVIGNDTAYVLFSETSFISVGANYVYDYVKVRVYEDLAVEVVAQYLDPVTFDVEMNETFDCPYDTGAVEAPGISLYEL